LYITHFLFAHAVASDAGTSPFREIEGNGILKLAKSPPLLPSTRAAREKITTDTIAVSRCHHLFDPRSTLPRHLDQQGKPAQSYKISHASFHRTRRLVLMRVLNRVRASSIDDDEEDVDAAVRRMDVHRCMLLLGE